MNYSQISIFIFLPNAKNATSQPRESRARERFIHGFHEVRNVFFEPGVQKFSIVFYSRHKKIQKICKL